MSPREEVQNELRDTLYFLGLNEVYGILEGKHTNAKGKSYRSLTFCKARILDGEVHIYSPGFIMVSWTTAIRSMPHKGREIFRNALDCKRWLTRNFAY